MVHLTRIYTKFGDAGQTMLGDGSVVPKTSIRVGAYGAVDEANSALGLVICECQQDPRGQAMRPDLLAIQQDLFDVGADLCTPITPEEKPGDRLRIRADDPKRLERLIDAANANLKPLNSFVLPGGSRLAAALHLARTAVRRAERETAALLEAEPDRANPHTLVYLNRLSDLLFVLARAANDGGAGDVLWSPGSNRAK